MKRIIFITFLLLFLSAGVALAKTGASPNMGSPFAGGNFVEFIVNIYTFGRNIAGVLAVGMIALGGFYIAISGAVDKQQEGKEMITSAILGLVLLFGAHLILNTINPSLVNLQAPQSSNITAYIRECANSEFPGANGCVKECTNKANTEPTGCSPNVRFCRGRQEPENDNCVGRMEVCKEGENPGDYFPPQCYKTVPTTCVFPSADFCNPQVITIGEGSELAERSSELRASINNAEAYCDEEFPDRLALEDVDLVTSEKSYDDCVQKRIVPPQNELSDVVAQLEAEEAAREDSGPIEIFPDCGIGHSCNDSLRGKPLYETLKEAKVGINVKYARYPYYRKNIGAETPICVAYAYKDLENPDSKWVMAGLRGLQLCRTTF